MSEVRQRRSETTAVKTPSPSNSKKALAKPPNVLVVAAVVAVAVVGVLLFPERLPPVVHNTMDRAVLTLGLVTPRHEFAVILDAGSTGSRLLAFTFHRGVLDGALRLDSEHWLEVKPGLSSYAENPAEAANSIASLLHEAKSRIPETHWASTPVTLKATAGLRLLPKEQSEAILEEVETVLRQSSFRPAQTLIEIMNPMEEGLFAWFTINFLLDELSSPHRSHATLDLGGGSTQIVFVPSKKVEGLENRKHFTHAVSVGGHDMEIYSHSYLGLGLMAAREAIFQTDHPEGSTSVASPCVRSDRALTWQFHGNEYTISSSNASLINCLGVVQRLIQREDVHSPAELLSRQVIAFSYFYDKAVEGGLIGHTFQASVHVRDFRAVADRACSADNSEFLCVDLTFIYVLLTEGYGFPDSKQIFLYKKINGYETSWALGVAFSLLEKSSPA
jgi:ectonucleoside triphosphate diphosphohydrolase 5/6